MILLDVGVWLAATWGGHVHHPVVAAWFEQQSQRLVLCRVTQVSLLRLLSNPAVMGSDVVDRSGAWDVVDELRADSRVMWADEPPSSRTHLACTVGPRGQQPQALDGRLFGGLCSSGRPGAGDARWWPCGALCIRPRRDVR